MRHDRALDSRNTHIDVPHGRCKGSDCSQNIYVTAGIVKAGPASAGPVLPID